jgi:DNA polymerase III epsilon subunit-like protein
MCKDCRPAGVTDLAKPLVSDRFEPEWSAPEALAAVVAPLLDDATVIAANPAFDAGFLAAFLRDHGQAPTWHYRLRDIGSMAWGALARLCDFPDTLPLDASTDDLAQALGIDLSTFDRHTALGDCQLVAAMLRAIEGGLA